MVIARLSIGGNVQYARLVPTKLVVDFLIEESVSRQNAHTTTLSTKLATINSAFREEVTFCNNVNCKTIDNRIHIKLIDHHR